MHRAEIAAEISGRKLGEKVTVEVIASILKVYLRLTPAGARSTVFINKVAEKGELREAESIVRLLGVKEGLAGSVAEAKFWLISRE